MTTPDNAIQILQTTYPTAGLPALRDARFTLAAGDAHLDVTITDGDVAFVPPSDEGAFTFTVTPADWARFTSEPPPRGYTTAQAMRATIGWEAVTGDRTAWAVNSPLIDGILDVLRQAQTPRPPRNADPAPTPGRSPIEGSYLTIPVQDQLQRIYVESSGTGQQTILCLHTAGADSRQFRYLLEDEELTRRYRFVAFDMPWHGRSDPPSDWAEQTYQLTTETYAATILAVMDALDMERPILMGCSMGGAIAIYLSATHGDRFSAALALEGGLGNPGRFVPWTNHLSVDHSHFLTSWVGGLIAPSSPQASRAQTLWGYAQSGPGVYQGDTYFYSNDLPGLADDLGTATCPLWIFNGEYDYSATTEMSREAAERIGGTLVEMPGFGHFPMSEDPAVFRSYLVPVLDELEAAVSATPSSEELA
ncbi:alpha/beta fold hydrolase [Ornithinimicrobium cavernae]|uniref:alpha/beta fold hydrolase n=1 Tax=Ornithinimicrobium cavernae TaxID=2666047 RepID=UPI000D69FD2C|nr:alpha/beta hydrolase [Ornithinimicrobium cavernae]